MKKKSFRIVDIKNGETVFTSNNFDETVNKSFELNSQKEKDHPGYITYYTNLEPEPQPIFTLSKESKKRVIDIAKKLIEEIKSKDGPFSKEEKDKILKMKAEFDRSITIALKKFDEVNAGKGEINNEDILL